MRREREPKLEQDTLPYERLDTAAARWQIARRNDGWVVRLIGANGEKILSSELLERRDDAVHAIQLVRLSMPGASLDASSLSFAWVDERHSGSP